MEEGTFVEWLKNDGDEVKPGDLIYTVESDKTTVEVENFDTGILRIPPNAPAPGARIPVGTLLAYVAQPGEGLPFGPPAARDGSPAQTHGSEVVSQTSAAGERRAVADDPGPTSGDREPAISPRARRAAMELGVDWSKLTGSGITGRIVERDVRAAATTTTPERTSRINASPVAQRAAQELGVDLTALAAMMPDKRIERADVERSVAERSAIGDVQASLAPQLPAAGAVAGAARVATRQPMSRTRRAIAERMSATARSVAPVTLTTEVDASELVRLRQALKADTGAANAGAASAGATVPGYNDLLAKVASKALLEHAHMNARIEGDEIVTEAGTHIGIAVDTERGLLVVVLRDVQDKGVRQIARESQSLIARARDGKAMPGDVRGSTFTITNLGVFEIDAFTPIINAPECAILGVGRIARRPVIIGNKVRARHMMTLSLTFDHRLVDGAPAARFLQRIKRLIEQPYVWLVD
jgi:pyruvate dehydrogenase E2 component (dihydrolipoamide acetyltransferase)